jgi:hypothetical protein
MLKLYLISILIFNITNQATDQSAREPLLPKTTASTIDKNSKPYTFYYRLKDHSYRLYEVKTSCCARTKYFVDHELVTKKEYEAAFLNKEYAFVTHQLAYMNEHKITNPDMKLSILLARDFNKKRLIIKLFNEAHPSCCSIM